MILYLPKRRTKEEFEKTYTKEILQKLDRIYKKYKLKEVKE